MSIFDKRYPPKKATAADIAANLSSGGSVSGAHAGPNYGQVQSLSPQGYGGQQQVSGGCCFSCFYGLPVQL
jgi:hypothetical protein